MKKEKQLTVQDLLKRVYNMENLFDYFHSQIVKGYVSNPNNLQMRTSWAVIGILDAYENELQTNRQQYETSPEKREEVSVKIEDIESFISNYGGKNNSSSHSCKSVLESFETDAKTICEKFEKMYAKEIEEYKATKSKEEEHSDPDCLSFFWHK